MNPVNILALALMISVGLTLSAAQAKTKSTAKGMASSQTETTETAARGGADPGGGGAYRINGQLYTLAQAGVIFERAAQLGSKKYPVYYEVKEETKNQLNQIISQLPLFLKAEDILGGRGSLIDESEIDSDGYKSIASAYEKVIRTFGKKLDRSAFTLVAFAKQGKTHILPTFGELDPKQQALYLIHEYFMRRKPTLLGAPVEVKKFDADWLGNVLNLDSIIYGVITSGFKAEQWTPYLKALLSFGVISKSTVAFETLKHLEAKRGRPFLLSELLINENLNMVIFKDCSAIDPSLAQKLNRYLPGLAELLEGYSFCGAGTSEVHRFFSFDTWKISKQNIHVQIGYSEKIREVCTQHKTLIEQSKVPGDRLLIFNKEVHLTTNCQQSIDMFLMMENEVRRSQ